MKQQLFTVYDRAAKTFDGPIMKHQNSNAVIRDFTRTIRNPQTQLGQYPQDYDLYLVGEQDDNTGEIWPIKPELLITGAAAAATEENK